MKSWLMFAGSSITQDIRHCLAFLKNFQDTLPVRRCPFSSNGPKDLSFGIGRYGMGNYNEAERI
jgi:hypothetical protein